MKRYQVKEEISYFVMFHSTDLELIDNILRFKIGNYIMTVRDDPTRR